MINGNCLKTAENRTSTLPFSRLLQQDYRRSTLLLWTAFFTIMFSFYFISSWTPALLKEAGMTMEQSVSIGMMISLGGTVGALFFGLLASYWSPKKYQLFLLYFQHWWLSVLFYPARSFGWQ